MAKDKETRQRPFKLAARFNAQEDQAVRQAAGRAGVSVAAYLRYALLNVPPLRGARRPTADQQAVARVLTELGRVATAMKEAIAAGVVDPASPDTIEAARALSDMRAVCLQALGRAP